MFEQITIVAPGLLGASVAMAAKARGLAQSVSVYARRDEVVAELKGKDWCDKATTNLKSACRGSELIVLCAPVERIIELAETIAPKLSQRPIVTDVGSVKREIVESCERCLANTADFVGSHPMAGSEKTGMQHAHPDLFANRSCFVTPTENTEKKAASAVAAFWTALGSQIILESPAKHDETVAQLSHLPHLLAAALASYLSQSTHNASAASGNGLRDTIRIAAGDPTLWSEIVSQNRQEILRSLEGFHNKLEAFKTAIADSNDVEVLKTLAEGKAFRDEL